MAFPQSPDPRRPPAPRVKTPGSAALGQERFSPFTSPRGQVEVSVVARGILEVVQRHETRINVVLSQSYHSSAVASESLRNQHSHRSAGFVSPSGISFRAVHLVGRVYNP